MKFLKKLLIISALAALAIVSISCAQSSRGQSQNQAYDPKLPTVYMTKDISPDGLMKMYKALGRELPGKIAIKISTGEPGGHNFLSPNLIKKLVQSLNGTIVECNTAYKGKRYRTKDHLKAAKDHGFTAIAPVDIMDAKGEMVLKYPKGKHIKKNYVGINFKNYDSFVILSHFKGHAMGGFGGALKNMSIGIASSSGKMWIHTVGHTKNTKSFGPAMRANHNNFLESMADAAGSVIQYLGKNIIYINVVNNLSVDCDCVGNPANPEMDDIGIVASLDPVALDQASVDLIYNYKDKKHSAALRQRIESRNGTLILKHAQDLGLGSRKYNLVLIK